LFIELSILFQWQSYSFFISVFVYPTLHTFPVTVLFLLYFCIYLSNSPYFSSDSPIPSLFLYLFIQLSIPFQWQSYFFFISVFVYPTLHTFPVTVLFLLYFCICFSIYCWTFSRLVYEWNISWWILNNQQSN
jgi:hypothetical protein